MVTEHAPLSHELTLSELSPMPLPAAVLMSSPDYFDVVDVKNPFMEGQQGKVDRALARRQWEQVRQAFEAAGAEVSTLPAVAGCEDMVFCANPAFSGLDGEGRPLCILSRMRFPSRQPEVAAHAQWYSSHGYRIASMDAGLFEGSGDALWHPGRRLIWGGYGHRTNKSVYDRVSQLFDTPIITLELNTRFFYHLDTCLCPISETTALVYPRALTAEGLSLVRQVFPDVIEVDDHEATDLMACNAAAFFGKHVVIQRGSVKVNRELSHRGFEVIEVDTSEFLKSGGSVFCMKMYLF